MPSTPAHGPSRWVKGGAIHLTLKPLHKSCQLKRTILQTTNGYRRREMRNAVDVGTRHSVRICTWNVTGLTPEAFKVAHQAMIKRGAQLVFADGYNEDGQSRLVGYWRRGAARTEIQT